MLIITLDSQFFYCITSSRKIRMGFKLQESFFMMKRRRTPRSVVVLNTLIRSRKLGTKTIEWVDWCPHWGDSNWSNCDWWIRIKNHCRKHMMKLNLEEKQTSGRHLLKPCGSTCWRRAEAEVTDLTVSWRKSYETKRCFQSAIWRLNSYLESVGMLNG